jgi:hypothetical protein
MELCCQIHAPNALPTPGKIFHATHYVGGWGRLRADLNFVRKRKILAPAGNRNSVAQPIVRDCTELLYKGYVVN